MQPMFKTGNFIVNLQVLPYVMDLSELSGYP